jgi:acyl-coenzyme A thioesterase PaaI-like protein
MATRRDGTAGGIGAEDLGQVMNERVPRVEDFVGLALGPDGSAVFELGEHLLGAFGGVFGGALAAGAVALARRELPGRVPVSIDCRFLRALPAGSAPARVEPLHLGRSLACVRVEVVRARENRPAFVATVALVAPQGLGPLPLRPGMPAPRAHGASSMPREERRRAWSAPENRTVPIAATLRPSVVPLDDGWFAGVVRLPWEEPGWLAEAACVAADLCVGPPVAAPLFAAGRWVPHPNPDVSMHFVPVELDSGEPGEEALPGASEAEAIGLGPEEIAGLGRLERLAGGVATVALRVVDPVHGLLAVGSCTSLLLKG